MPAFLVPVDPGQCLIPLEKAIVLIGRQSDCDVSLTHSRKISRKHCCIAQVNSRFVVRDLGSTNGIFLNGNRVQKEADLNLGDDLIIGDVHFRVQDTPTPLAKPGPAPAPNKSADSSPPKMVAKPLPSPKPPVNPPPSMDIPVALPDDDQEFAVEVTSARRPAVPVKVRVDDVVPLRDDEDSNDPIPLASDSI